MYAKTNTTSNSSNTSSKKCGRSTHILCKRLGFTIAFADDSKNPTYAGIRLDGIEIHLQWHNAKEWESGFNTPMLRIVTEHIENLFEEYKYREVFYESTKIRETQWQTREFAFFDLYNNGLTFYQNL